MNPCVRQNKIVLVPISDDQKQIVINNLAYGHELGMNKSEYPYITKRVTDALLDGGYSLVKINRAELLINDMQWEVHCTVNGNETKKDEV